MRLGRMAFASARSDAAQTPVLTRREKYVSNK